MSCFCELFTIQEMQKRRGGAAEEHELLKFEEKKKIGRIKRWETVGE